MTHASRRLLRCSCVVLALAPAPASVFVGCGTNEAPPRTPSTAEPSASAPAIETTTPVTIASTTPSETTAAASASATSDSAASASGVSSSPPPSVKLIEYYGKCAAAGAVATFINAHRACKVDGDCVVVTTAGGVPGSCGVGIAKSAGVELRAKSDAAYKACTKAGIPMPIPTCPPTPPARCGEGACRP